MNEKFDSKTAATIPDECDCPNGRAEHMSTCASLRATLATVKPGGCVQLPTSERERFEAWAGDCGYPIRRGFGRQDDYEFMETRRMWESWQAALAAQPSPGRQGDASHLSVYADSYRRMAKMGDGRVSCIDVAFDIEHNMSRALAARQPETAHAAYHTGKAIGRREAELEASEPVRIYGCCAQPEGELHTAECPNLRHLAARQPVKLIAQKVGDYRVTVAEDTITVSRGRDIVFAYSAGDPEPINARQPVGEPPVGRVRTKVDGGFIAELLPGVSDRVSNMAPLYLQQPTQPVDLSPEDRGMLARCLRYCREDAVDDGSAREIERLLALIDSQA